MNTTTTKPTATPEAAAILAINPAIFKGLHIKLGFDFQQPVTIRRIPAPFTIKKAWKIIEADHSPATSTAAIIMRDTGNTWGIYRDLHMTPITADNLRDVPELDPAAVAALELIPCKTLDDVLAAALVKERLQPAAVQFCRPTVSAPLYKENTHA